MTTPALTNPLAAVEAKLRALIHEILGPDTAPGLTVALYPDGFPILIITARRDGRISRSVLDLDIAAGLSDQQLDQEIRWMVGHAVDLLVDDDDQCGDS